MKYDVVVLGLGAMGSAAAAHLAGRGAAVLGLEQFGPAHALGSSHGASRIIRKAYFEHPLYVPLVLRAYALWDALERETGARLFLRTGGLMAGPAGSPVVEGARRSAEQHGLPHIWLDMAGIRDRFPALCPRTDESGVFEPDAGILFPEAAVQAHLDISAGRGAQLLFEAPVRSWTAGANGVTVSSSDGEQHEADQLVITAGAWLAGLVPEWKRLLQVERNVMHWFAPAGEKGALGPEALPVYVLERREQPVIYGFPDLPGEGIKAGIHHSGVNVSPDTVERAVSGAEVESFHRQLSAWIPAASGPHLQSAVCLYTNTPDEHFLIGRAPGQTRVWVAGGFSGHGFKFSPVIGEILAELVETGATRHDISLFAPGRFAA